MVRQEELRDDVEVIIQTSRKRVRAWVVGVARHPDLLQALAGAARPWRRLCSSGAAAHGLLGGRLSRLFSDIDRFERVSSWELLGRNTAECFVLGNSDFIFSWPVFVFVDVFVPVR